MYDPEYVQIVKDTIKKIKEQYALLVYDRKNLKDLDNNDIQFNINDQIFLETLLMEIRGKTISYASFSISEHEGGSGSIITEN